jgi:hypothetical protein
LEPQLKSREISSHQMNPSDQFAYRVMNISKQEGSRFYPVPFPNQDLSTIVQLKRDSSPRTSASIPPQIGIGKLWERPVILFRYL